jgi:hypothetical protein
LVDRALKRDATEKLAQDRANHNKKAKVIFLQIDSVRANPVVAGLDDDPQDRSVDRELLTLSERVARRH